MGLDNIPHKYPCVKAGTVIYTEDGKIDCDTTIAKNNCPWHIEFNLDPIVSKSKPSYGMLGTGCWYRGKYGNALLRLLEHGDFDGYYDDTKYSFYGEGFEDGQEGMSAEYCSEMSKWMKDNAEKFAEQAYAYASKEEDCNPQELIADWIYAAWWLNFVSKNADGSSIWY